MKKPLPFFRGLEGTIMVFSLFIILGGTLVLAGWAQMLATRATYATMTEEGQKRRIAMANGRALARQYVLNQMPAAASFLGTNYSLANGWGGFDVSVPPVNQWTNTNFTIGNPFNPISDSSFVAVTPGHISNSAETNTWTFLIRSRSPVLAGFPAVFHAPTLTSDTNQFTNVTTYKIYWTNLVGLPNSPDIPFTSGATASGPGTNAYVGYFASPLNTNNSYIEVTTQTNALSITNYNTNGATFVSTNAGPNTNTLITNYTGGSLTVVLNSTNTTANALLRYQVANSMTNVYSTTNVAGSKTYIRRYSNGLATNLTLVASTATNTLHLIADANNTNLTALTLRGTNNTRRVYFYRNSSRDLTLRTESRATNYTWWMGVTAVNTNADLIITAPTNTRSLTLTGGIRTDRTITVTGQLTIISNSVSPISGTNTANIETIADRILWLEEQRTP
jgi:hypothetical protein